MARVIVITGATAGVGRATAREFARNGDKLVLLARDSARLKSAKDELEGMGSPKVMTSSVDVADHRKIFAAAARAEKELGPVDVWVNNAMASVFSEAVEMSPEEYERVTGVTYLSVVYGTLAALKYMWPRNKGKIIQVGSALAYRGIPLQSSYCGAKHAIQGFSESVRSELLHNGKDITLTMIQMPALNTPQFRWVRSKLPRKSQPVPPIYQPEVAGRAIFWASYQNEREFVVGGKNALIIFLNKLFPGYGDKYLSQHYDDQMTDEPAEKRDDNLFSPVSGDFQARGEFNDRAKDHSKWFLFYSQRKIVGLAFLFLLMIVLVLWAVQGL